MNPIATDNGRFKDGNPATGEYGTVVTAEHVNNVQDAVRTNQGEILTVLKEAGIEPNETDETQLWQALQVMAGQVESIEALRQFEPVRDRQIVYVKSYYAGSNVGGGEFYADLSDKATADNRGTVIVTTNGIRWKRVYQQITPLDFGAIGDNTADDTAIFKQIEQVVTHAYINLLGLTYKVTSDFNSNHYFNGSLVNKGIGSYNKELSLYKDHQARINAGNSSKVGHLTLEASGLTDEEKWLLSFHQSAAYDENTQALWVTATNQQNSETNDADKPSSLIKYIFNGANTCDPVHISPPSEYIGHQNIGIQRQNGVVKFWVTGGKANKPERSRYFNRLEYDEGTQTFKNIESYKLFGNDFNADGSRCIAVSPNYQVLIASNTRTVDGAFVMRVFDLNHFTSGGDYSDKYLYQWVFDRNDVDGKGGAVQSIATDGRFVYILVSGASNAKCCVHVYTINGNHVSTDRDMRLGMADAKNIEKNGGTYYYEPEALFWLPIAGKSSLCCLSIMGIPKGKPWHANIINSFSISNPVFLRETSGKLPALQLDAEHDIGYVNQFGVSKINPNGSVTNTIDGRDDYLNINPIATGGGGVQVNAKGNGRQAQYRLTTDNRDAMLQISNGDNLGIYDILNGFWAFMSDKTGKSFVPKSLSLGDYLEIFFDDTKQPQVRLKNALRQGMLQISTSGNLGLYDNTNNKWLIYAGADGIPKLHQSPALSANNDDIPTTYWVRKLLNEFISGQKAQNGYLKVGDFIFQWGRYDAANGARTFYFPIEFPNTCYVVLPVDWNSISGAGTHPVASRDYTKASFSIEANDNLGGFMMIAVGV